jgi:hypothetical protein
MGQRQDVPEISSFHLVREVFHLKGRLLIGFYLDALHMAVHYYACVTDGSLLKSASTPTVVLFATGIPPQRRKYPRHTP